jgi:predicted ATPase
LSATQDWSYDLLTNVERAVFQRLSILVGLFTLEAACCVAAREVSDRSQIVTIIASLVAKSLVAVDTGGATARYRLLDSTRFYAADKLASTGELDEIKRRHAIYFRDCLEAVVTEQSKSREGRTLLTEQIANARVALEWCFSARGDKGIGIELATAAAPLLSELSLFAECNRWTETALQASATFAQDNRRLRNQMKLQASLGASLLLTRGYQSEARSALTKALALAEQLDDAVFQMRLMRGLHMFLLRVGEFRNAALLAQQNLEIASMTADPSAIAMANWVVGLSNYFMGNQLSAEASCEACLNEPRSPRVNEAYFWFDDHTRIRVRCAYAAIRWLRGFPDQAARIAQEAINQGTTQEHPATFSTSLILASFMLLRIGDMRIAEDAIGQLVAHVERHSLNPFRAIGAGLQGALSIHRGELEAGVQLLRQAIKKLEADRYELHVSMFLGFLAEGLLGLGHLSEALSAIEGAIERAKCIGLSVNLPELLRVKGSIFAAEPRADVIQAEACYLASLELADQQSALAWKLRTATSLATLRLRRGEIVRAQNTLTPIYDSYTEGFQSRDLVIAKGLLDELDRERQPGG